MRTIRLVLLALVCVAASPLLYAQTRLTVAEAKDHIGEKATVCGSVVEHPLRGQDERQPYLPASRSTVPEAGFHDPDLGQ